MTSSFEQSFKKRLQLIARDRSLTPAEVWQNVICERFLVRLCASPYCSHFIFKGGMLLARDVALGRETQDLDFAVSRLSNEVAVLKKAIVEIICLENEDGFIFTNP